MSYELVTRNGHNMYDMASLLQKSIRRCNLSLAAYAAYELYGNYANYMWRRLLVISAEDCYGIMTKEIIALREADIILNKDRKGYEKECVFMSKAVCLLCLARKNRDACFLACNYMVTDRVLKPDEIPMADIDKEKKLYELPDWVFDKHTLKGKAMGKTRVDMTYDEGEALEPKQIGFFDNGSWGLEYESEKRKGKLTDYEWQQYIEKLSNRIKDPTPMYIMDDRDESVIKLEKIKQLYNDNKQDLDKIKEILDSDV